VRFTLLTGSTPGNDMNLDVKRIEANRNFANKIWNAGRFVISAIFALQETGDQGLGNKVLSQSPDSSSLITWSLADSWIWARLQQLVRDVERLFQTYQFGEAGRQIYDFFWSDFADWYVETAKLQMQKEETRTQTVETLVRVLDISLRLLHPFTPFVTEELWGHLRRAVGQNSILSHLAKEWTEALIVAPWPEPRGPEGWEETKLADFALVQEIIRSIRNLRAEKKVSPAKRLPATIVGGAGTELLKEQAEVIASLSGLDYSLLSILGSLDSKPEDAIALVVGSVEVHVPLSGMVDMDEERTRLEKELSSLQVQIERLEKLLASDFASKAPAAVVQKEREKLAAFRETAEKLKAQLG
jgi:valyl-tRNA synthetase